MQFLYLWRAAKAKLFPRKSVRGDVISAAKPGPPFQWGVGKQGGKIVEIHTTSATERNGATASPDVTIGKIMFPFKHNSRNGVQQERGCPEAGPLDRRATLCVGGCEKRPRNKPSDWTCVPALVNVRTVTSLPDVRCAVTFSSRGNFAVRTLVNGGENTPGAARPHTTSRRKLQAAVTI